MRADKHHRSIHGSARHAATLATVVAAGLALAGCSNISLPFFSDAAGSGVAEEPSVDNAEAIEHFREKIVEKPDEVEVVLGLARNLRWAGQADEAAATLENSVIDFGDDGRYLAEIGKVRIAQGRIAEGVVLLAEAVARRPDDWRLHSALGVGNDYLGQHAVALGSYEKALELCPDDAAVINNMAISQGMAGDIDRAIITLQTALSYGRHTREIKMNLKTFRDARDLCADCGARYLRETGQASLAEGMAGTDALGPCKPEPAFTEPEVTVMTQQLQVAPSINIKVYFEFDSAILRPEAQKVLDELGEALTSDELKGYRFEIAGHTDAVGTESYNQKLSEQRARAVLDYLVLVFNIDGSRIDTAGYGESRPLDPNDPEGDINRRVQITRLQKM